LLLLSFPTASGLMLLVYICLSPHTKSISISVTAEQNSLLTPCIPLFCSCRSTVPVCCKPQLASGYRRVMVQAEDGYPRTGLTLCLRSILEWEQIVSLLAGSIPQFAVFPMSVKEVSEGCFVLGVCRCGTAYTCSSDC